MTALIHHFDNVADADGPLDIVPVGGRIGAEIRGVRLGGHLDDDIVAAIRAALVRHKVIFFRDQTHLDDETHEAFAARLGEPLAHPTVPVAEGSRFLLELNSKEGEAASAWHTDITFLPAFPSASILRALTIPPRRRRHSMGQRSGGLCQPSRPAQGAGRAAARGAHQCL